MEPPLFPTGGPQTVRAAPGTFASLVLPLPIGSPPIQYTWSRAGASLDERFVTSDDAGGVRLTVSAARTGDSGVYTLQASNAAGKDTTRVRLEVSPDEAPVGDDPPNFLRRLQDLTVKVGTRTRFLVEIVSSTECKVTWYRNERRLMETERVALVRDGNFWCADVATVSVDDAGRWTCTAENVGGRASCSAHLNVLVPKAYKRPEFVEELRALLTEQGTVSLECKVVGVPTPILRWFKDSREIKAGDVFALTANADDPTSLGTYTCEAVNCMGRAYSSSKVHVVGRASREGSVRPSSGGLTPDPPPIFTKELEDQFVRICEPLTLNCHIVVPPWPRSVVWYNKEGKIEPSERYHVLEDGVGGYLLEVCSAEWADEGEWKCVASTAGGRVGMTACYVSMDVPKNYRKPRFMENLQAVLTEEGLVSFECKVVGFPTPVLSWFKDGQELKPGDVYQLTGTNSLGSYCCIAKNCMGQASSSAELTVEDIQNQLNEEEKHQLFSKNQAPKFLQGLKSLEAKIDEPFRFTIKVAIPPEPSLLWYRDDQPVDESCRCHHGKEDRGVFYLDIQNLEFLDQAEWKCVAMNDYGQSVTSCFLKLIIPRHYKKPRFLENLQAILSDEGAVNLECKVIGVPQPVLKWYKDGEELKPGDIHRIISGQDGTCCLGTYTCEAQNCMGIAASSASLLGFDDSMKQKNKKKAEEQTLQRNLSLSTIHEERTSQMYDTPVGDRTLDDKGEISFSFDGKEVSVSLYETPDLTEEEALQIVEMYADQLSENVTEHNVVELPPLRFVKETSTSGNLLMEAIIIDVSPEYFASPEEDLRTEADIEDISIADENGPPQISLDQEKEMSSQDYLEKTMALLSDEKSDIPRKLGRKMSDSQRSGDDYFSLSRDQSLSEEKKDDDTQILSESDLQSYESAKSSAKVKSKISKPSLNDPVCEVVEVTNNKLFGDDEETITAKPDEPVPKLKRRSSRGTRRSSSGSEKSISKVKNENSVCIEQPPRKLIADEEYKNKINEVSNSLSKIINDIQIIERDIILQSEFMSSAATASKSLEIIGSLINPISEIQSIVEYAKEATSLSPVIDSTLFNSLSTHFKVLYQSLTIIEKCIDVESDNKTLVKKTCISLIEKCGNEIQNIVQDINTLISKKCVGVDETIVSQVESVSNEMITLIRFSTDTIKARSLLHEASEIKSGVPSLDMQHSKDTQKAIFELKTSLRSLLRIVESTERDNLTDASEIKSSDIILNDMSASIQSLQEALEQIESLSIKESTTSLIKYNTEIIETVMDSVIRLRSSFEQLSVEAKKEDNEDTLKQVLSTVKLNLNELSSHIHVFENKVGKFDIIQGENKLEVLQKMAQTLISFENSLPILDIVPDLKEHIVAFHKHLTRVLENVIESNDGAKYFAFLEICDTISRVNSSIKSMEALDVYSLTSVSNTLKIIQDQFIQKVFTPELNCSVLSSIEDLQMNLLKNINVAADVSLKTDFDSIQDLQGTKQEEFKANLVLQSIEQSIAAITYVTSEECTKQFKIDMSPILESILPNLENLKQNIASLTAVETEQEEHVSELSDISVMQSLANPLCELNQNIIVLNQTLMENVESFKENSDVAVTYAQPLHELLSMLEVLQHEVISQHGEYISPNVISSNIANVVDNLQNCIILVQEQSGVETVDEISTLEDVSGIKTTAEIIPPDHQVPLTTVEVFTEQHTDKLKALPPYLETAQTLQTLKEHATILQHPNILEFLDVLSECSDYTSLKSVAIRLEELNEGLQEILHPMLVENTSEIHDSLNTSKLMQIAMPLQDLYHSLSIVEDSNIPIYENILKMPSEKIHSAIKTLSDFKQQLDTCIRAICSAQGTADKRVDRLSNMELTKKICDDLKNIIKDFEETTDLNPELRAFKHNLIDCLLAIDQEHVDPSKVKTVIMDLNEKLLVVQDELIECKSQPYESIAQEIKLIETVHQLERSIAVLEQYEFVDLSGTYDIVSCVSPQLAQEIQADSLIQIEDLVDQAVSIMQDVEHESQTPDLMILEDFFRTCKIEFSILRCLITKRPSHKKLIRILQEFNLLRCIVINFKTKLIELSLSKDLNELLLNFIVSLDISMKDIEESLIKMVNSQSTLLFDTPLETLNRNTKTLLYITKVNNTQNIVDFLNMFLKIVKDVSPNFDNLKSAIMDELQSPQANVEKSITDETMNLFLDYVDEEMAHLNEDDLYKQIVESVFFCLQKHQDFKEIVGQSKALMLLKCLSECSTILKQILTDELEQDTQFLIESEVIVLKSVLGEMAEPLQGLRSQLEKIQEQISSGADEESISIDITSTESYVQALTDVHNDVLQLLQSENTIVDENDISLIEELDKEIHIIQENIQSVESTVNTDVTKHIAFPLENIEKSLLLAKEKMSVESKSRLPKDINSNISSLEYFLNRFIKLDADLMATSELIKDIDIKKCLSLAIEIANMLNPTENVYYIDSANELRHEKITELIHMLMKFDWLNTDRFYENRDAVMIEKMKRVFLAAYQLLSELNNIDIGLNGPDMAKDEAESLLKHLDQYIEFVEIVEEVTAVLKLDDLQHTASTSRELRESIDEVLKSNKYEVQIELDDKQELLMHRLHKGLLDFNEEILDSVLEIAPIFGDNKKQHVMEVVEFLKADLGAITGQSAVVQTAYQTPMQKHTCSTDFEDLPSGPQEKSIDTTYAGAETVSTVEGENVDVIKEKEETHEENKHEVLDEIKPVTSEKSVSITVQNMPNLTHENQVNIAMAEDSSPTIGTLLEHIEEYICDNFLQDLRKLEITKEIVGLEGSAHIAKELLDSVIALEVLPSEAVIILKNEKNLKLKELICNLHETLHIVNDLMLENVEEIKPLIGHERFGRVTEVVKKLLADIDVTVGTKKDETKDLEVDSKDTLQTQVSQPEILEKDDFKMSIDEATDLEIHARTDIKHGSDETMESDTIREHDSQLIQLNVDDKAGSYIPGEITEVSELGAEIVRDDKESLSKDMNLLEHSAITVPLESQIVRELETDVDSMKKLEMLLSEVNSQVELYSTLQDAEYLRNTLDEVQTVIIKLKRDFDGSANDTLNETLEDLECSVRSVQLQIDENSAPNLLKDACATLQLLVTNMSDIKDQVSHPAAEQTSNMILEKCSEGTEQTIKLLDAAAKTNVDGQMISLLSKLNLLKDTLKILWTSFRGNADTLINNGIDVTQRLDQMEEHIFALEKEIDAATCNPDVKDSLTIAVHAVYESISNMRSAILSIQKEFMYENYGKPSEKLLHSLKNISIIYEDDDKISWKHFSKVLRQVLNHFEDIKFYVNFDKTARIPSDAGFTKIVLEELSKVLRNVVLANALDSYPELSGIVQEVIENVEGCNLTLESRSSLEVKEKIPIFKNISDLMLILTDGFVRYKKEDTSTVVMQKSMQQMQSLTQQPLVLEAVDEASSSKALISCKPTENETILEAGEDESVQESEISCDKYNLEKKLMEVDIITEEQRGTAEATSSCSFDSDVQIVNRESLENEEKTICSLEKEEVAPTFKNMEDEITTDAEIENHRHLELTCSEEHLERRNETMEENLTDNKGLFAEHESATEKEVHIEEIDSQEAEKRDLHEKQEQHAEQLHEETEFQLVKDEVETNQLEEMLGFDNNNQDAGINQLENLATSEEKDDSTEFKDLEQVQKLALDIDIHSGEDVILGEGVMFQSEKEIKNNICDRGVISKEKDEAISDYEEKEMFLPENENQTQTEDKEKSEKDKEDAIRKPKEEEIQSQKEETENKDAKLLIQDQEEELQLENSKQLKEANIREENYENLSGEKKEKEAEIREFEHQALLEKEKNDCEIKENEEKLVSEAVKHPEEEENFRKETNEKLLLENVKHDTEIEQLQEQAIHDVRKKDDEINPKEEEVFLPLQKREKDDEMKNKNKGEFSLNREKEEVEEKQTEEQERVEEGKQELDVQLIEAEFDDEAKLKEEKDDEIKNKENPDTIHMEKGSHDVEEKQFDNLAQSENKKKVAELKLEEKLCVGNQPEAEENQSEDKESPEKEGQEAEGKLKEEKKQEDEPWLQKENDDNTKNREEQENLRLKNEGQEADEINTEEKVSLDRVREDEIKRRKTEELLQLEKEAEENQLEEQSLLEKVKEDGDKKESEYKVILDKERDDEIKSKETEEMIQLEKATQTSKEKHPDEQELLVQGREETKIKLKEEENLGFAQEQQEIEINKFNDKAIQKVDEMEIEEKKQLEREQGSKQDPGDNWGKLDEQAEVKNTENDTEMKIKEQEKLLVEKEKQEANKKEFEDKAILERESDEVIKCKDTQELTHKEIEEMTRKETEEMTRKENEELTCIETEAMTRKETEEMTRKETEEMTCKETEEMTRKETEELTREATEEMTCKETEVMTRKETEEMTRKETEEKLQLEKEKIESDKNKLEKQAQLEKQDKDAELRLKEEEKLRLENEKQEAEKKESEHKAKLEQEKNDEIKRKQNEEKLRLEKERREAEEKQLQERARLEKEEKEAQLKLEEEKLRIEKEKQEAERKESENKARLERERHDEIKRKDMEAQLQLKKEKKGAEEKQLEEQERLEKEKKDVEMKLEEEKLRLQTEKQEAEKKESEYRARLERERDDEIKRKEMEAQLQLEKEKKEAEEKQLEEQARLEKEKKDVEMKLEEEKLRLQTEKQEAEKKESEHKAKLEQERNDEIKRKQNEEKIRLEKEKQEAEEKQIEERARLEKEERETEIKHKEEEKLRIEKEKQEAEKKESEDKARLERERDDEIKRKEMEAQLQLEEEKKDAEEKQLKERARLEKEKKDVEMKLEEEVKLRLQTEKQEAEKKESDHKAKLEQERNDEIKRKQNEEKLWLEKEKQEAEEKQIEERARLEKEEKEAEMKHKEEEKLRIEKEKQEAEIKESEDNARLERERDDEIKRKEMETQLQLEKEKKDAEEKQLEEQARLEKQKKGVQMKLEEEKLRVQTEKQEAEKKESEHRVKLEQERNDEIKRKQNEEKLWLEKEKQEAEEKQIEERARLEKEEKEAEIKHKEEEKLRIEKEKQEAEKKESEGKARLERERDDEIKRKEMEAQLQLEKEKKDAEEKQLEEQERLEKEKKDAEEKQLVEQERLEKEKKDVEMKLEEEVKLRLQTEKQEAEKKESEHKAKLEQERNDEIKRKQNEEKLWLEKEKQEAEEKQIEERARLEKEEKEAEMKHKEEEKLRIEKEKQEAETKESEDKARLERERDDEIKRKEMEAQLQLEKEKKEAEEKQLEEQARLEKEKKDVEMKLEEEMKLRLQTEKQEAEKKESEHKAKLEQERNDEIKRKQNEEKLWLEKETKKAEEKQLREHAQLENERKDAEMKLKKEEMLRLEKKKQEAEVKQLQERVRLEKEEKEAEMKHKEEEKLRIEKEKQEAEIKESEDKARLERERDDEINRKEMEAQLQLESEKQDQSNDQTKLQRQKKDDIKDKKVEKLRLGKEKQKSVKGDEQKKDKDKGKETAELVKLEKEKQDSVKRQSEGQALFVKEAHEAEIKRKEEMVQLHINQHEDDQVQLENNMKLENKKKVTDVKIKERAEKHHFKKLIQEDEDTNSQKDKDENRRLINEKQEGEKKILEQKARLEENLEVDIQSVENKKQDRKGKRVCKIADEQTLQVHNELTLSSESYVKRKTEEEFNANRKTDENVHKFNGSMDKYKIGELDISYTTNEPKQKTHYINYNHNSNIGLEMSLPPGYIEKRSYENNRLPTMDIDTARKIPTTYKAQTLLYQSQIRSSTPQYYESGRNSESTERRSDLRQRSKALSETRSSLVEKRTTSPRDHKRKPVFSTYLTDRTAVEASRVKLTCSVLSSTDPTITWYKNGVLLDNKLKYRTKVLDGLITLEVLNAVPDDSAEYTCTVQNDSGSVSTSANLKVYPSFEASPIPPTFTRSIRDTYHLAENELILESRIRGQPLPTITWLKDDRPLCDDERCQAYYLADGVCRLVISAPVTTDSGKYTCKAENSMWSDQITHVVNFTGKESCLGPNLATLDRSRFNRQVLESRRPHFTNVLTDYKVTRGGTIGLQVEIKGSPTRVEWLREGNAVIDTYRNAQTFVDQGLYTLALSDVTEKESGLYTCRAWSTHGNVDMNAAITVVQPNELEGKPAIIVGRPEKDVLISVGEDLNVSFRVQGEPKPKVIFMKGIRDITNSQRVCKMTSDDYVKFTLKRSVVSDAGTYCILARNVYGCDRAFVTVVVRQRASSENLISDWTYTYDDTTLSTAERKYKSVPDRIPGEPSVVDGGNNWASLAWPKPEHQESSPVLAYKVESWLIGKEGGARWTELGITPLNSFDAFNLKQGGEYHFRVTPRNKYGWGEPVQTSNAIGIGLAGDRPEFTEILPGQLKVLVGQTANLSCSFKGKPTPEIVWMKNGHEIDDDLRIRTLLNGYDCSLTIKDVQIEDEGRYSCEASNVHGRASTYARMAVITDRLVWEADAKLKRERSAGIEGEYPPQFTMRLRDRRVQATYPVRLTCQVIGNPPPLVTWFKDGQELSYDSRHNQCKDEHFHTLEIAPTSLEDGGVYEAMARNNSGAVSCRCSLVVDKGIRAYVAPEFCCGLEPLYRLCEGEELRISAMVEAYPSVGVTWYRDGVRLRPSRRAIMTLDHDGQIELALASVTRRDAGVYMCTASNEVGQASTSGKVDVTGGDKEEDKIRTPPVVISPDVPYSKEPMFTRKPRSSEAREGDTVIIECEVIGDPKPDVYWLRDFLKPDYYRDANHFKRVGAGPEYRFEIPHAKLDYTGTYSVVARNAHGEAKAIISLQILAKDIDASDDAHNIRYGRVDVIPRFDKELTDLLCYDGDAIEFECRVSGDPEPYIKWLHYNEVVRDNQDFETCYDEGTARLKIKQVTAEDEGTYTCEASNSLGKAKSSACLVVYPPGEPNTLSQRLRRPPALLSAASTPRSTPRATPARSLSRTPGPDPRRLCSPSREIAPKFYTYPFNKVVEEGERVVFKCAVKGLPNPWATWDKDGIILTPTSRITMREKDEILRILEIEEVTIEDVGLYRITLENDYGRAEASARLEVITHKGKFYGGVRSCSASPRRTLFHRRRTPSTSRQD